MSKVNDLVGFLRKRVKELEAALENKKPTLGQEGRLSYSDPTVCYVCGR